MLKKSILFAFFTLSSTSFAFDCTAIRRVTINSNVTETTEKLVGNDEKKIIDIEEAYFSYTKIAPETYVAMITIGPDYTTGNLAKATFDKDNKYKLTYITPSSSYILNCETKVSN